MILWRILNLFFVYKFSAMSSCYFYNQRESKCYKIAKVLYSFLKQYFLHKNCIVSRVKSPNIQNSSWITDSLLHYFLLSGLLHFLVWVNPLLLLHTQVFHQKKIQYLCFCWYFSLLSENCCLQVPLKCAQKLSSFRSSFLILPISV